MSLLTTALRLLAARELTEQQLRARLARKGFAPDAIDACLNRLRSDGLLDDRRFAFARARAAAAEGRKGPHRVRRELEGAGIPATLAKAAVREAFGTVDPLVQIDRVVDRRLRGRLLRTDADYRRLYQYLLRQGFEASDIMTVLRRRFGEP